MQFDRRLFRKNRKVVSYATRFCHEEFQEDKSCNILVESQVLEDKIIELAFSFSLYKSASLWDRATPLICISKQRTMFGVSVRG